MSAAPTPGSLWSDITGDIESCISRVQGLYFMAEGLIKESRRGGNALAVFADDLEHDLVSLRNRLHAKVLEERAAS